MKKRRGLNDKGPRAVITELGVMRFGADKRMYLAECFPAGFRFTCIDVK